ncbi:MAG: YceI family protein [Phycisphaerales bacterium]
MKNRLLAFATGGMIASVAVLSLTTVSDASAPAEGRVVADAYTVDGVHSSVTFRVKHQNVAYFYGRFNKVSGSFNLDEANVSASKLDVTIDVDSVDTANEGRDKHLRTADFFSVKEFPTATFKSTSVESKGEKQYLVKGDLTIRGVTKQVEATVVDTGRGAGRGGSKVAGFETMFKFNRADYGITYGKDSLGDEITLYVSLEGGMK